jgi:hypothetical protein
MRHGSWGRRVIAGRAWGASRRRVRVRPEVHAPAEAGYLRIESIAATRGAFPPRAAEAVPAGPQQIMGFEHRDDVTGRTTW